MTDEALTQLEREAKQREHDRTGEHVWVDVSTSSDVERRLICAYCSATKVLQFRALTG